MDSIHLLQFNFRAKKCPISYYSVHLTEKYTNITLLLPT